MPTYGPLGTSVSLYTWEADAHHEGSAQGDLTQTYEVERIREDNFDNQRLDFLGPSSAPFFLVNAGQDLFSQTAGSNDGDAVLEVNPVTTTKRVNSTPAARSILPGSPPDNDLTESDHDTTLSSLNSSLFERSPQTTEGTPRNEAGEGAGVGAASAPSRSTKNSNKIRSLMKPLISNNKAISKPITSPKPIKLQIDLSTRSFMPSLISNVPEDVCVSVFYNGEFTYSKIFRWSTFSSGQKAECGHPTISGRRIGTTIEIPWVIKPMPQNVKLSVIEKHLLTAGATWDKIGQSLLAEADKWGRDGKFDMFRNPVGEYLESLSKLPIPKRAWPLGAKGLSIGVVDVIIGLGRSINHPYRILHRPQRKLTQARCGLENQLFVVPKDLGSTKFRQMIAAFQDEDDKKKVVRAPKNAPKPDTRPKAVEPRARRVPQSSASQVSALFKPMQRSRSATMSTSVISADPAEVTNASESFSTGHDGLIERGQISDRYMALNIPADGSPLKVTSTAQDDSNPQQKPVISKPVISMPLPISKLPKNIPQKRYRGPTPPPAKAEDVISVYTEPSSHSTRSRTSVSIAHSPDVDIPLASIPNSSQNPVDRTPDAPPYRRRAKSRRLSQPKTMISTGSPFGLDGQDDDYYEVWHEPLNFPQISGFPLRQHASAETNQVYRRDMDFGLDGTGDAPKSTKRKRSSLEAPSSEVAPRSKVPRTKVKGQKASDTQSLLSNGDITAAGSALGTEAQLGNGPESLLNRPLSQTQDGNLATRKPRQRNTLSARELGSLLEPHKPSVDADTSFGQSFKEIDFQSRPTRNSTKQKVRANFSSTTRPRVTAVVQDGRIFIIKGLRPSEFPAKNHRVQAFEATNPGPFRRPSIPRTSSDGGAMESVTTDRSPVSVPRSRILGSTKSMGPDGSDDKLDLLVDKDSLHTVDKSAKALQAGGDIEIGQNLGKGALPVDTQKLAKDLPLPANGTSARANNKENFHPSTKNGTHFSVESLQNQGLEANNAAVPDSIVLPSPHYKQQFHSVQDTDRIGDADIGRNESRGSSQRITSAVAHPTTSRNQKYGVKMPPIMKFKTTASIIPHTEPQTPSKKEAKEKPSLTIQTGIANAYRTYDVSSTGQKTPTPRSAPLPPLDPARTRALTRTPRDTDQVSAIVMPSMVRFTPQRNATPSRGLLADMSSSPTVPSPSNKARDLRSSKQSATSNASYFTQSQIRQAKRESLQPWKPSSPSQHSVLSYVDEKNNDGLPGLKYDKSTGRMCRVVKYEREGIFRTSGILMGVRYVFGLGSDTAKQF
ncbi:uncharacterized protein RCO7_01056 [Rhynchosporium graminicola]|uniref:Uncharacterized protein n=1 Tax=Rhynchosporium graminicola TaxID=2792576 RepID=A0A1E1JQI8_9HELO|nr:uncharacterized protein RCO7_01056 [Rhynchosporium commune]